MSRAFMLLGLTFIYLMYSYLHHDIYMQWLLQDRIQSAVENAVHDAVIQLDLEEKENGNIVFDRTLAHQAIVNSLKKSLTLDQNLQPLSNSPLLSPLTIQLEAYFDDQNTTFPYLYTNHQFQSLLRQPSIILVVKTQSYGFSYYSYKGPIFAYSTYGYERSL